MGPRLENCHRVRWRAHASWHIQRYRSQEERVALELRANFRQSLKVEHFPFPDVTVSDRRANPVRQGQELEEVETYQWACPIHLADTHALKLRLAWGRPNQEYDISQPHKPMPRADITRRWRLTSQEMASPATAVMPLSQSHSRSSMDASTPACSASSCAAYSFFCCSVKVSHSGIMPVWMKRMSPLRGVTFSALHMARMLSKETAWVEKHEYFIGGDCDEAQRW